MPEKLNAMTLELAEAFGDVVARLREDPSDFGAVVITGAGRAFSAGGDLDWLRRRCSDTPSRNAQIMRDFYGMFLCVRRIPLPVIAAVNGPAIGAGLCFAMACDIRVVAKQAKLGFTFVGLGLHPGMGATHLVASVAGYEVAHRLLLSGELIGGSKAQELHLATQVAEDGASAQAEAMRLAGQIAAQAPVAVRATVLSLRQKQDQGLEAALLREADAQAHGYGTADCREGLAAVAEKRRPNFVQYESHADTELPPGRRSRL